MKNLYIIIFLFLFISPAWAEVGVKVKYPIKAQQYSSGGLAFAIGQGGETITITRPHEEIHDGEAFVVAVNDADFDKSDTINICFTTSDTTTKLHVVPIYACSVPSMFNILEGSTVTNGSGTPYTATNRDFSSPNISGVLDCEASPAVGFVSTNCTITADGTLKYPEALGAGKNAKGGAGSRGTSEYILNPNTTYCFRITGTNVTDNGVGSLSLSWYGYGH